MEAYLFHLIVTIKRDTKLLHIMIIFVNSLILLFYFLYIILITLFSIIFILALILGEKCEVLIPQITTQLLHGAESFLGS